MPLNKVYDEISVNVPFFGGRSQSLLEGEAFVPDYKPDITQVLWSSGIPVASNVAAIEGGINYKLELPVTVLYAAGSDGSLYSVSATLSAEDFVPAEGVLPDMEALVLPSLEHLEATLINDRKVGLRAVVGIAAIAYANNTYKLLRELSPSAETEEAKMNFSLKTPFVTEKITITDSASLPQSKPDIQEILEWGVRLSGVDLKSQNGRARISGTLALSALYRPENNELLEVLDASLPFTGFVDIPGLSEGENLSGEVSVQSSELSVEPNSNGENRIMSLTVILQPKISVLRETETSFLRDAYATDGSLSAKQQKISIPVFQGQSNGAETIVQTVELPLKNPDIMQVLKVFANIRTDDVIPYENRITAEGIIEANVLYIAKDDRTPVSVAEFKLPYSQTLEMRGVTPDSKITASVTLPNARASVPGERELELILTPELKAEAFGTMEEIILEDVEELEEPAAPLNFASIIIYIVQPKDSLWSIAKKFNTTLENIKSVNDLENPELIYPGQRILVLKRSR
ncbi:MAG: DUF3794 domain-containing protein [Firmicutes bacterium]|nr:DUF3794 domain-containing protein [Bacillota bacterium]